MRRLRPAPAVAAAGALLLPALSHAAPPPLPWEVRATVGSLQPKGRIRDGSPGLTADNIQIGGDLKADDNVFSPAAEISYGDDEDRYAFGGWAAQASGSAALPDTKAYGGQTLAAGTPVTSSLEWISLRAEYRHTLPLFGGAVNQTAGLALDWTRFHSKLEFPGGAASTTLNGIFPSPQLSYEFPFSDPLSLDFGAGGFFVPFPNGNTRITDPIEYRAAVRSTWDRFGLEAGYYLYHVHLEERRTRPEEEVIHMRMRSVYLGAIFKF